ncbi:C40 family peptidase [Echinicola marina]|uniref:C40 family peptidase n=1 Tax=Echinicola marina TaxID=2859768 RepID=UPI001CF6AC1B|nr:C40 family peptidase [Echinicola marina]UCS95113.1 C40 family peptidase [Echinicola marina]
MRTKPVSPLLLIALFSSLLFFSSCSASKKAYKRNVNTVVQTAKTFRGTPYRYGGTTRAGMDCSALLYLSFQSIGINLPRTSEAQSKAGKKISVNKLEKGDVLFFATGKKKRKVTHAGIVTDTDRKSIQFIHSSSSLGVTEDNLYSKYWHPRFIRARRYF